MPSTRVSQDNYNPCTAFAWSAFLWADDPTAVSYQQNDKPIPSGVWRSNTTGSFWTNAGFSSPTWSRNLGVGGRAGIRFNDVRLVPNLNIAAGSSYTGQLFRASVPSCRYPNTAIVVGFKDGPGGESNQFLFVYLSNPYYGVSWRGTNGANNRNIQHWGAPTGTSRVVSDRYSNNSSFTLRAVWTDEMGANGGSYLTWNGTAYPTGANLVAPGYVFPNQLQLGVDSAPNNQQSIRATLGFFGVFPGDISIQPGWPAFKNWVYTYYGLTII